MRILIVRHAEPDYVHDSLTEKGKREALLLGERLSRIPASAYYVSPLGRAQATADYTLRRVGRQAETLPWLSEFRGYTVQNGKRRIPWDYPMQAWYDHKELLDRDAWLNDPLTQGGTVAEIWEETKAGMDALLKKHGYVRRGGVYLCEENKDDTIVIFCHFGIGMAILAHLMNVSPLPLWQSFLCLPSAVTTVVTQERKKGEVEFRCVGLGDIATCSWAMKGRPWPGCSPSAITGWIPPTPPPGPASRKSRSSGNTEGDRKKRL